MKKAVFLDRDGTLSMEMGYIHEADLPRYALYPGAGAALARLGAAGWTRVLVTNQSGVARGYYPEAQVHQVHARLAELLKAEGGALDALYYCPHHADPGGKPDTGEDSPGMVAAKPVPSLSIDCDCRKPKPGMGLRAARELGLDLGASWMVGDKAAAIERSGADVVVATDAGCLMNIAGCLRRRGSKVKTMHLAEVLGNT